MALPNLSRKKYNIYIGADLLDKAHTYLKMIKNKTRKDKKCATGHY